MREYDQHALLATVRASQSRPGWAYERFCQEGPLALLPHQQGVDQYSVVWCCRPGTADHLRNLPDDAFVAALQDAFVERLGRLSLHGARHVFPLSLKARSTLVDGRIVAIGNAAQTLHPVAGQGLNLGLRDAVQLATALAPELAHGANDTSDAIPTALPTYSRRRMADRWITGCVTDLLPRVFATGWAPLEHACGAALLALDASARLRATLARHLLYGTRTYVSSHRSSTVGSDIHSFSFIVANRHTHPIASIGAISWRVKSLPCVLAPGLSPTTCASPPWRG